MSALYRPNNFIDKVSFKSCQVDLKNTQEKCCFTDPLRFVFLSLFQYPRRTSFKNLNYLSFLAGDLAFPAGFVALTVTHSPQLCLALIWAHKKHSPPAATWLSQHIQFQVLKCLCKGLFWEILGFS